MIINNTLSARLNSYKIGEIITVPENDSEELLLDEQLTNNSLILQAINYLIDITFFILKCVAFGYSLKIVFNTDWKFVAVAAIGFSIEVMTTKLFNIFHKN